MYWPLLWRLPRSERITVNAHFLLHAISELPRCSLDDLPQAI
jgi:hypothetical protein